MNKTNKAALSAMPLLERTDGIWLNEPQVWSVSGDLLQVVTDQATDFWRETHYGFVRDSGHFLGFPTCV